MERSGAPGIQKKNHPALKARWNIPMRAISVPDVAFVERYLVTTQELAKFGLKSHLEVVIRLVLDVGMRAKNQFTLSKERATVMSGLAS